MVPCTLVADDGGRGTIPAQLQDAFEVWCLSSMLQGNTSSSSSSRLLGEGAAAECLDIRQLHAEENFS